MNELTALLRLNHIPFLGAAKIRLLLDIYKSAQTVFALSEEELTNISGFSAKILEFWKKRLHCEAWKKDVEQIEKEQVKILAFNQEDYPKSLLKIKDYPLLLYVKGSLQPNNCSIAVVGTRKPTYYGLDMAESISRDLAAAGSSVISGLALGIDTAAHTGALQTGKTWAVLGSGLSCIYPKENERLAQTITNNGALISEFPMCTPPDRFRFPQRNRLVSGLSQGVLLIEAPKKSGAILTLEKAYEQKKPIFSLPGRVDQENFRGNHAWIKEKKANLVENAQDILKTMGQQDIEFNFSSPISYSASLNQEEKQVINCLPNGQELTVEEIAQQLPWPIASLNVLLISLVLKRVIKEYPGKIYKKV